MLNKLTEFIPNNMRNTIKLFFTKYWLRIKRKLNLTVANIRLLHYHLQYIQFRLYFLQLTTNRTRKPTACRLVSLCHFFLIEKPPFPKSMSMCEKKLQSILKLFDYPRDCQGEIV